MENFIAYNPVKLYFGKNVTDNLGNVISKKWKKVLLIYGQGSVKKNGIYDKVYMNLIDSGIEVIEYGGIRPNPVIEDVNAAIKLGAESNVDCVIGLGGGSVIDSAKVIAMCIPEKIDGWSLMKGKVTPEEVLPVISILTLAATGSEMNKFAVIQNHNTNEKIGYGEDRMYPQYSFLDPSFTFSVNREHTAYGIVDLIAHALENFFGTGEAELADRFVISILKEAMVIAPLLNENPNDYHLRARMMWAATNALNGNTFYGRRMPDFGVHALGHTLSLLYDIPHGASLSIVYPAWLKILKDKLSGRLTLLGKGIFGYDNPDKVIDGLTYFFSGVGSPVNLLAAGIDISHKSEILKLWKDKKPAGNVYKFTDDEYEIIINYMFDDSH